MCVCVCVCHKYANVFVERKGWVSTPPPSPRRLLTLNLFDIVRMCLRIEFLRERGSEGDGGEEEERAHI